MKIFFVLLFMTLLLVACSNTHQKTEFVPVQISWESAGDVDTDSKEVSACLVHMTNALMSHPAVQRHAQDNITYMAVISSNTSSDSLQLDFVGACPKDAMLEREVCSFSASCDFKGNIVNLKMGLE